MNIHSEPSLAEQRQRIRRQLQSQRNSVVEQFAPDRKDTGSFPRSVTMRLLIQWPPLLVRLAGMIAGGRFAIAVPAIFGVVRILRLAIAIQGPKALAAPKPANPGARSL